ncbi:DNA helicase [candidate division WOR-1 bacterium DG_54_3]|uniref:Replicative DNA helicase n=1 Tax=candidate division WOR-1 bacterium DG_54_3 TaxID=1703775 RepID=A0A0S7Y6E1_UNCSA|nr:MAG: DNA helicase [candidate division WOR-1 bacterium DG_54_3]
MFLKKTPPHNLEAEKTVLGGILISNKNLNVVLSIISPEDFYKETNQRIIQTIISLVDKGQPVDLLTLSEELQKVGILEEIGGASYLSSLMDGVPKSLNIEYHARIIKEKSLLRRLILSSAKIINSSYEQKEDADELLNEAQKAIIEVAEQRIKPGFVPVSALTTPTLEMINIISQRQEAVTGVPTGFRDLDNLTSGFHSSEFVVIAGRPSMGKTALSLNISHYVGIKTDYSVGFFSLEMAKEQVVIRLLCAEAQLDIKKVRTGFIGERDIEKLKLGAEALSGARIFVDETPALTVMEMKAKARRLKMEENLDILFIDYMQLMRTGGRFENRNQEMSYISRSLKELSKEIQIPVVGISQLSRAPERGRKEPRPQLSDLRESGAIEQDADVVIFIYRPELYRPKDEGLRGIAEINVAKQRNGPVGIINLAFIREYARFADLEFQYAEA